MTVLATSKEADAKVGKTHKTTIDWAIQIMIKVRKWLPQRKIIFTGDGGFANATLAWACLKYRVSLVTRLRPDARLFDFPKVKSGPGRRAKKGNRLLSPKEMFNLQDLLWVKTKVRWYGGSLKTIEYITTICLWHVVGYDPVPIKLVLLRDPKGKYEAVPLMSTDVHPAAEKIIEAFVGRRNQEVTHREVRDYLGVETQRQWSDLAIARTTPVLFGLYSLVILMADMINLFYPLRAEETAWYHKEGVTFSDALKEVRRHLWEARCFKSSGKKLEPHEIPSEREPASLIDQLAGVA